MGNSAKNDLTFLEHLEELRWHIVRSIIAILSMAVAAFMFKSVVFDTIILGPNQSWFPTNRLLCSLGNMMNIDVLCINKKALKLQNIQMAGQFMAHIKISIIAGVVASFPYVTYEFWRFFSPALYTTEKKYARGAIVVISLLFFLGIAFGYYVIAPLSINFLYNYQVSPVAVNDIKLMSYVSTIAGISFASGILFELPVVVFFLSRLGLVTPVILKKYRKHAFIAILLLSAIITPPDVFSQILVSLPLLVLYEIGIKISARVERKRFKQQKDS
jgi:sec-independent protein translocase protein TatC